MLALVLATAFAAAPEPSLMPRGQVLDEIARIETAWPSTTPSTVGIALSGASSVLGFALILSDTFSACFTCSARTLRTDVGQTMIALGIVGGLATGLVFVRMMVLRSVDRAYHHALLERIHRLDEAHHPD